MNTDLTHQATLACDAAEAWHRRCLERVGALDAAFRRMPTTPRLSAPWAHFTRGLREHFAVEESRVFPAIRALSRGESPDREDFAGPLHDLRFELDEIRTVCDALANAAPDAGPHEAELQELLDELEEHARREERELFPLAMELLTRWTATGAAEAPAGPPPPLREPAGALDALLARRRGCAVQVVTAEDGFACRRAAEDATLCIARAEAPVDPAKLRAPIAEVLLVVGDDEGATREALGALRGLEVPVSLLASDAHRAGIAWKLAMKSENLHVHEVFFLGEQDPEQLAAAFGVGPGSTHPESIRALQDLIAALREAFHAPPSPEWHWAVARLPGGAVHAAELFDLSALSRAARAYRELASKHPNRARAQLLAAMVQHASGPEAARLLGGLARQQALGRLRRRGRARDALLVATFASGR